MHTSKPYLVLSPTNQYVSSPNQAQTAWSPSGTKPKQHPWCACQSDLQSWSSSTPPKPISFHQLSVSPLRRRTGKFPQKSPVHLLGKSPQSHSGVSLQQSAGIQARALQDFPRFMQPPRVAKNCNQANGGSAIFCSESQTHETSAGAKETRFYSDSMQPGKMVDSHLKGHLP